MPRGRLATVSLVFACLGPVLLIALCEGIWLTVALDDTSGGPPLVARVLRVLPPLVPLAVGVVAAARYRRRGHDRLGALARGLVWALVLAVPAPIVALALP
jgi:hypothetical protein